MCKKNSQVNIYNLNKILKKHFKAQPYINVLLPSTPFTLSSTILHDPLLETHPVATIKNHSLPNFIRLRLGKIAGTSEAIAYSLVPAWGRCVINMAPVDKHWE